MANSPCVVNGEGDLGEMDGLARETDVSLDEMMSLACRQGKLDIVELLLESGARVDYRNKAGNTPLLEACSQGHRDVAQYLLEHGANIDAPTDTTSDSALTWACTLGNDSIVDLLLSKSSNVEHRTKDGCTALMFAALAGHVKVAAMLLDFKANINVESDSNKDSPLTFACWKGHVDVVELLLKRSANIEHRTKEGFTPLMFSALGGHTAVAKKLLERLAKVNEPSGSNNDIPLTSACWKGHHEVVKLLLEYKSNIEHRTKDGCTPLMLAAREGHLIVAQLILDSGALVNVPSGSENNIPLTLACWKGHTDVVELLLNHKSNIEHRNKAGCTPLMLAAREGHLATTKLLLDRGTDVNTPSGSNDDTPLTLACWKGHHEVVDLLLEEHSSVDHQTKTGCTPLMEATREGHVRVVCLLLESGADVELPDNYGQSPLFMACWKGHRDVAELLLRCNANRECRTKTGITPLFQACRENHVSVVELLLDQGASVSASFPNSRENPMTLAAEKGYVELMEVLLNRGGNVDCRTKKGCSPFFLACKEGHLEIAISLYRNSADIEVCDQRNISPLVAAFRNGHHKVVEWILSIAKHVPSDEQCQKCITAPLEGKDNDRDLLYLRTTCYEMIKKAKKVKEQAAFQNAQSFLQELEEDKVREENKKKKQAAKRRDKRKKKKKQKENEQRSNSSNVEPLPSENRTYNVNDMEEDNTCSEEESTRDSSFMLNHVESSPKHETGRDAPELKHVTQCRTKTVGQALDEICNTNSTEERRDDQPQAVFDASDNHETASPKKGEPTMKSTQDFENNKKNSGGYHGKCSPRHRSQDGNSERGVQSPTCVKEREELSSPRIENAAVDKYSGLLGNGKVKHSEVTASEVTCKVNMVKNSGTSFLNNDPNLKENGRVLASRTKQASFDFLNCWKEVTRNSSSKTMVIQLTAPNALCGRVIGRGGTKINGITDESGAQITIGKPDPKTPNDRVITIKGTVKAVQKARLLVSQALNTPSGITQTQTPNLSSSASSSQVYSQSTSSAAPIRGDFAAIPSSSVEWPTVAQANRIGLTKEPTPLIQNPENKTVSVSEQGSEKIQGEARETRANSAPDLHCEPEKASSASGVWSVDTMSTKGSASYSVTSSTVEADSFSRMVSTAGCSTSSASSSTKPRTKSYALTQDNSSRLSYCEVATGMENGLGKMDDVKKVTPSSTTMNSSVTSSFRATSDSIQYPGHGPVEECDNVFADENSFPRKMPEQLDVDEEVVFAKEPFVSCSPWNEETTEYENDHQTSPHSNVNEPSTSRKPMDILSQSTSLFTGTPWSSRDHNESDKTRSVSWSGQDYSESDDHVTRDDFQSSQPDINSLSSHSIWSPVPSNNLPIGGDGDAVESTVWDNSNSASSSRSSSRLELSSIMENEKNTSTSSFLQTSPPDAREENSIDLVTDEDYQSSWLPSRGAHSAPSSPSLERSRGQRLKLGRPVTAQSNSYDDMSDRLWSRRTNEDPLHEDTNWNANVTRRSLSSNVYRNHVNDCGDHTNVLNSSPKLGSFKHYHGTSVDKWNDRLLDTTAIDDVLRLLDRLSLTKYNQTFEKNCITMDKLVNMTENDLQEIGVPKGPRLKIMHAIQRGNNGMTNGPAVHAVHKTVNDRVTSIVPTPDILGQVQSSGALLNRMQMDPSSRVPPHTSFAPVLPTTPQVLQKQHAETIMNPMLLSYLTSSSVSHPHHSLLSLDPGLPGPSTHAHLEQHMNGLPPQQQFMLQPPVHNDQYDPQNSYMGAVPYQQQMFYPRPPGHYYYYP